MLGPNGAGKTTTVRMMTTLTIPTSGTARVAGHDVIKEPAAVRRNMGLTGQAATVDELLTGRENLRLIGALYGLSTTLHQAGQRRPPRTVLADRRRQPDRQDLLGGHAKTARPGGEPGGDAAGALPRRTHDRSRPPEPGRAVGRAPRAGLGRHDAAVDHAVPRGGRPAGRPDRRDRQGPGHRRGHPARAQGPVREGGPGDHRVERDRPRRWPRGCSATRCRRSTSTPGPASSPPRPTACGT